MAIPEEITTVRAWTNEEIPGGGTDADTNFTDATINELIDALGSMEAAAADLWRRKAARLLTGKLVEEKTVGSEKLKFMSTKDRYTLFMDMADYYDSITPAPEVVGIVDGTHLAEIVPHDILHTADTAAPEDISRLIGPY